MGNEKERKTTQMMTIRKTHFYAILAVILILFSLLVWPGVTAAIPYFHTPTLTRTMTLRPTKTNTPPSTATLTPQPTFTSTPTPTSTPYSYQFSPNFGTLILAIQEGVHSHLFAYSPALKGEGDQLTGLPLLRLTTGNHQDITPALSPDGDKLAFASNRSGVWDIYLLNLENGHISQFTDTKEYEAHPTWSPDGNWLAYESYQNDNLDIFIRDLAKENTPINLTNHPRTDHSPSWSAEGRKISFVSTRDGSSKVWIVDLDQPTEEKRISPLNMPAQRVQHPSWSPDGRYLTWGSITQSGLHQLFTWDSHNPSRNPQPTGSGDWPLWSGNGQLLFTIQETAHETYLAAFPAHTLEPKVMLPAIKMPGTVQGITWGEDAALEGILGPAAVITPTPLWKEDASSSPPEDRLDLLSLGDVQAPYPKLSQKAAPSFHELRSTIANRAGWDFLSTLDNAYLPLTAPPDPSSEQNWLFTGRGIAINSLPLQAGWMVVVREDFGAQTYWRLFVRTLSQQGNQGQPLRYLPWDFDAQYEGSIQQYERGGSPADAVPDGYWADFTSIANAYGWNRLPALPRWRTSFPMTRYREFAFMDDLDWQTAMLEIYPPEALYTATPNPTSSP